jgi:hypothetical protein
MRWAPNNSGFTGFFAELITQLLDRGASYVEIPITCKHYEKYLKKNVIFAHQNILSTVHTLLNIFLRRLRKVLFMKLEGNVL